MSDTLPSNRPPKTGVSEIDLAPVGHPDRTALDSWIQIPGIGTGYIRPSWQTRLEAVGLARSDDFFQIEGEPLIKPGLGARYRARIPLRHGADADVVYLKRYGRERWGNLLRRWFEDGRRGPVAEREVRVAEALARIAVPTVQPVAWGWVGPWGPGQRSFVVFARAPGVSLAQWLDCIEPGPPRETRRSMGHVAERLAVLTRRLHAARWFHRDLYACHVHVDHPGPDARLTLLDLARVFQPRVRFQRWVIKDLAQLLYSSSSYASRSLQLRFVHHYFGTRKLNSTQRAVLRRVQAKRDRMARAGSRSP